MECRVSSCIIFWLVISFVFADISLGSNNNVASKRVVQKPVVQTTTEKELTETEELKEIKQFFKNPRPILKKLKKQIISQAVSYAFNPIKMWDDQLNYDQFYHIPTKEWQMNKIKAIKIPQTEQKKLIKLIRLIQFSDIQLVDPKARDILLVNLTDKAYKKIKLMDLPVIPDTWQAQNLVAIDYFKKANELTKGWENKTLALFTGDQVQIGTYREQQLFIDSLEHLTMPFLIIPGNHDIGFLGNWGYKVGLDHIKYLTIRKKFIPYIAEVFKLWRQKMLSHNQKFKLNLQCVSKKGFCSDSKLDIADNVYYSGIRRKKNNPFQYTSKVVFQKPLAGYFGMIFVCWDTNSEIGPYGKITHFQLKQVMDEMEPLLKQGKWLIVQIGHHQMLPIYKMVKRKIKFKNYFDYVLVNGVLFNQILSYYGGLYISGHTHHIKSKVYGLRGEAKVYELVGGSLVSDPFAASVISIYYSAKRQRFLMKLTPLTLKLNEHSEPVRKILIKRVKNSAVSTLKRWVASTTGKQPIK